MRQGGMSREDEARSHMSKLPLALQSNSLAPLLSSCFIGLSEAVVGQARLIGSGRARLAVEQRASGREKKIGARATRKFLLLFCLLPEQRERERERERERVELFAAVGYR
jgi:hypothetical protein